MQLIKRDQVLGTELAPKVELNTKRQQTIGLHGRCEQHKQEYRRMKIAWQTTSKMITLILALVCSPVFSSDLDLENYGKLSDGARHVTAAEANEILSLYPSVKVLDVRTGFEYKRGHLSDAVNANYYSRKFKKLLDGLDRDTTWLVHCRTGVRSGKSLPILKSLGFNSIIHLDGGIVAWTKSGFPTEK